MKTTVSDYGKEVVITPVGNIDTVTAGDLRKAVENQSFEKADAVIIDMAEVPYVSSAGLRELLIMQKRFPNGKITVRNVCENVREVFEITGFSDLFSFEEGGKPKDYTAYSFKDFLAKKVELFPGFIILDDGREQWTWKDLDKASDLVAEDLLSLGAKRGSHIALCGGNSLNWVATFFAIQKIGAMAVLVSPLLKASEICFLSGIGDISILCHGAGAWLLEGGEEFFKAVTDPENSRIKVLYDMLTPIDIKGRERTEMMGNVIASINVQKDDPCVMIFTSGTTGVPKGVLLSSFNLLTAATCGLSLIQTDDSDVYCLALPLFHIFGLAACLLAAMINESRTVIPPRLKPEDVLSCVENNGCTILNTVPTMVLGMAANPDFTEDKVKTLRWSVIGGAAISAPQLMYLHSRFKNTTFDIVYGLSEMSIVSYTRRGDSIERKTSSVGKPSELVTVRIQDMETGEECPAGVSGEILIQGEFLMSGYYKTPLEKQDFDEKGWFHTGDMGYLDEDGYLHFAGRKKEIIIRGGENIIPGEIGAVAASFPGVMACQIVGLPDEYYGEVVGCALVPAPGAGFDKEKFMSFLKERLASNKVPAHLVLYDMFPLLPNGKVDVISLKKDMVEKVKV